MTGWAKACQTFSARAAKTPVLSPQHSSGISHRHVPKSTYKTTTFVRLAYVATSFSEIVSGERLRFSQCCLDLRLSLQERLAVADDSVHRIKSMYGDLADGSEMKWAFYRRQFFRRTGDGSYRWSWRLDNILQIYPVDPGLCCAFSIDRSSDLQAYFECGNNSSLQPSGISRQTASEREGGRGEES